MCKKCFFTIFKLVSSTILRTLNLDALLLMQGKHWPRRMAPRDTDIVRSRKGRLSGHLFLESAMYFDSCQSTRRKSQQIS